MADAPPPPFPLSRETRIVVDREGRFFHEGDPVTHPALAERLASWLAVDPASGRYILSNAVNWAFVQVEDTPLVVRALVPGPGGSLIAHLSDGQSEPLDAATLRLVQPGEAEAAEHTPYVDVRQGSLPARLGRAAAHALFEHLSEDDAGQITLALPGGGSQVVPCEPWSRARQRRQSAAAG